MSLKIPECPWLEDVWPQTVNEAGKTMRAALGDEQTTAISGALMRHGWNLAIEEMRKLNNDGPG